MSVWRDSGTIVAARALSEPAACSRSGRLAQGLAAGVVCCGATSEPGLVATVLVCPCARAVRRGSGAGQVKGAPRELCVRVGVTCEDATVTQVAPEIVVVI